MIEEIEKDEEYLDEQFPKGKTKFRGQAMVLLALARIEGARKKDEEFLKMIDEIERDIGEDKESWKSHGRAGFRELKQKIKQKK